MAWDAWNESGFCAVTSTVLVHLTSWFTFDNQARQMPDCCFTCRISISHEKCQWMCATQSRHSLSLESFYVRCRQKKRRWFFFVSSCFSYNMSGDIFLYAIGEHFQWFNVKLNRRILQKLNEIKIGIQRHKKWKEPTKHCAFKSVAMEQHEQYKLWSRMHRLHTHIVLLAICFSNEIS